MEPFKITCVTCRAVLTVRKESMIGQIIACPRCSMMVQIAAPPGYVPAAKSSPAIESPAPPSPLSAPPAPLTKTKAAAAAAAASIFDAPESFAEMASPPAPTASSITPAPAVVVRTESSPAHSATFDDADAAFTDPPAATPGAPIDAAAVPPAPPTELPPVASRWAALKFPAMVAGGALAGAALVGTALMIFTHDDTASPTLAAASSEHSPAPSMPSDRAPAVAEQVPSDSANNQSVDDAVADNAATTPPVDATVDELFAADPAAGESTNVAEVPPAIDASAAEESTGEDSDPLTKQVADEAPSAQEPPKLRIDPLDIDPEGLNLSTIYNGPPKNPIALSDLPAEEPAPVSVPSRDEPVEAADPAAANANRPGPVRRDDQPGLAAPANVDALLARRIPSLKVEAMPLCRLLDDAVQWGGVPISISPEQLRMAAVSAGQPATAAVTDATMEEFLIAALKPLRLKPVVGGDQIMLIRIADDQLRSVDYAVDDLARGPADIEQLAADIQKLIAPASWQSTGGSGTLAIDGGKLKVSQPESIQYEILLLLERSRAALGLPSRSKYPAALIAAEAPAVALAERLGGPTTFTFSQYTPLREIFRHWQEELGVAVLVDWPALADLRIWPNTRIACSSAGKPWHAALDTILEPLGLAWRPIDRRTIEITTLEKAASAPLVEIYRLNPDALAAIDNLIGQLDQVAAAAGPHANSGEMANILNAEHSLLLVRQPALVQRTFADWLAHKGLLAAPK